MPSRPKQKTIRTILRRSVRHGQIRKDSAPSKSSLMNLGDVVGPCACIFLYVCHGSCWTENGLRQFPQLQFVQFWQADAADTRNVSRAQLVIGIARSSGKQKVR